MILDGKKLAAKLEADLFKKIASLNGRKPGLAFILVGENPASMSYVKGKQKACATVGIHSIVRHLSHQISESDLIKEIEKLNKDLNIDGILVQLPLPTHIDVANVTSAVDPEKDVDGFHPLNAGKLLLGQECFIPCTPNGIKTLLEKNKIALDGRHVVIVGRSNIVGKPLAALLVQKKTNATVTLAHSHTKNLGEITQTADILVAAIGKPRFITKQMIKPGAVVVDVGINRLPSGEIVGDVDFEKVKPIASAITPVPGGVGPMTIAMLLQNTLESYLKR